MSLTGNWDQASGLLSGMARHERWQNAWEKAATAEAHRLRGLMVKAFQDSGPHGAKWPPLAAFTQILSRINGRGDRKPLLYHGDLRNSIAVHSEKGVVFVGTHRSTKGRDGKSLVNLAMIHNYGTKTYTIRVTEKMRRFFMWLFIQSGGQIKPLSRSTTQLVVKIPARPWVEPIWEAEKDRAAENISRAIIADLMTPL